MKLNYINTIIFDFDGVFTDNKAWNDASGNEFIRCDRGDGLGIRILKNYIQRNGLDIQIAVVSKERNKSSASRTRKLGIDYHGGVDDKLSFIKTHLNCKDGKGLLYVGNDLNDLESMLFSEYSAAPSDAHERIKLIAKWTSEKCGGDGFVRDVIENLVDLPSMTAEEINRLTL